MNPVNRLSSVVSDEVWHRLSAEDIVQRLGTNRQTGPDQVKSGQPLHSCHHIVTIRII